MLFVIEIQLKYYLFCKILLQLSKDKTTYIFYAQTKGDLWFYYKKKLINRIIQLET